MRSLLCLIATFVASRARPPPAEYDTCSGPVQSNLRYGISGRRTSAGVPVKTNKDESLAEVVCCDSRALAFAEPQFLYQAPDIALYSKLNANGTTTFYDSVCGVALFEAPLNRTLAEFEADTDEHGWPSFRPAEVKTEHVFFNETTTLVTSSCGTHLGTYLPDDAGPRWCVDLSCVAGEPAGAATSLDAAAGAARTLNTTMYADECESDPKVYTTPLGACYSPPTLFPGDDQWGSFDARDELAAGAVRRAFFDTADGSCGAETDSVRVPLDSCVGPFGKPRPWGTLRVVFEG
mmetsp:Transcript_23201/g.72597  ORF Transcript_23201/g.72597 Transcript_23201/m.72597 type:complete len:292 (-) Transcript_23201:14-889(-)